MMFRLVSMLVGVTAVVSDTRDLTIISGVAKKGTLSGDQALTVLNTLDQTNTQDGWNYYKEIASGQDSNFLAQFNFKYNPEANDGPIQEIKIHTNAIGLPLIEQRRYFQIRNFGASQWEELGDNANTDDWKWQEQTFTITGDADHDLGGYLNSQQKLRIRYGSNNDRDVSNLDYLRVVVDVGSTQTTSAPTTGASTTSAPKTSPPTTSAPSTSPPTTSAPTTSPPTTSAPTTSAPTTSAPTTSAPTTSAPTTSAPTTSAPTTVAPTTSAPMTSSPTTNAPTTSAQTTSAPTTSADSPTPLLTNQPTPPTTTPAPTPQPTDPPPPGPVNDWWQPKASDRLTWQWQIQGKLDTSFNVDMYDIDLFDTTPAQIQALKDEGRIVVCYFSAGTYEGWRGDWKVHFPVVGEDSYSGNEKPFAGNMADWDERWLDIREIDLLAPIMRGRLQLAKDNGCDAVEPDNVDAYTNGDETLLALTGSDQLKYNRWLADEAHAVGLSIGLKNDVDQLEDLVDDFDWALNEQCFSYDECQGYVDHFVAQGKAVFGVEYSGSLQSFCPFANGNGLSWLKKRLSLKAWRKGCEDYE
jgi:hypothetical protein